jgi:hypothetical protein
MGACGSCAWRWWNRVRDVLIVFWVARVSLFTLILGFLLLDLTPQAQDLFTALAPSGVWQVAKFFILVLVVWAIPTHYSARLLLDTDKRLRLRAALRPNLGPIVVFIPRFLGLLTFLVVLIAIGRAASNLPDLKDPGYIEGIMSSLRCFVLYTVIVAILYCLYLTARKAKVVEDLFEKIARAVQHVLRRLWITVLAFLSWIIGGLHLLKGPMFAPAPGALADSRTVGKVLLGLVFVAFLAILAFGANWAAEQFPRAQVIPLVLGGWLPLLTLLSHFGRRFRAPLILATILGVMILTAIVGNNHSVRRVNVAEVAGQNGLTTRMGLGEAVTLWQQANECDGKPAACPRPIIVAAAGGASRAGYFMASIIGHLLQDAKLHGLDENKVRKRLFAISSVSGGSVGAVMVASALAATPDSEKKNPCPNASVDLWYGQKINNWRDCLEALMVGDFLSPTFIGLMFHDMFPFGWWPDRAAILEESWERRYASLIDVAAPDRPLKPCKGLECPFLSLRPTPAHWIPLLLLNGSSEGTGRRIVTTVLAPTYKPKAACPTAHRTGSATDPCLLLTETYYFHDLLADQAAPKGWLTNFQTRLQFEYYSKRVLNDVPLSTAAHNSARFPIISPPGSVRNKTHQIIDRIVDGGYFENYGALTAEELVDGIRAIEPGLAPFVLVVSNDPEVRVDHDDDLKPSSTQVEPVDIDDTELFTDLQSPLSAFLNSWNGRGTLAVEQLRAVLYQRMPRCISHVSHVRVWPEKSADGSEKARAVAMSWWLSAPLQLHLHQQTEADKNRNDNGPRLDRTWDALNAKSDCAEPKP